MTDVPTTELRAHLADHLNMAVRGEIIHITSYGRRVASLVPVTAAERLEAEDPALAREVSAS